MPDFIGTEFADTLNGIDGTDNITGLGGNDIIDGRAQEDVAIYRGNFDEYTIGFLDDGRVRITDTVADRDGSDLLTSVEYAGFADKTVNLQPAQDIAFVVDTTGSMGGDIRAVKTAANEILNTIFDEDYGLMNSRVAVVGFNDPNTRTYTNFTDQETVAERKAAALAGIQALTATGGGDYPEMLFNGLKRALDGRAGAWREEASVSRIFMFGDATAKDPGLADEVYALARDAYTGAQVSVTVIDAPDGLTGNLISLATDEGSVSVEVFTIAVRYNSALQAQFAEIASNTGGETFVAPNPQDLVEAILTVLRSATDGNDTIVGTVRDNTIDGLGGDDTLSGLEGDDVLYGREGHDRLSGGQGDDSIWGGNGNDRIEAGAGADIASGGDGADEIDGHRDDDILYGNDGNDIVRGGLGDDIVHGGRGDDLVSGNQGNDTAYGKEGDDRLRGWSGDDRLEGGVGNDTLEGNEGADLLWGGAGDDVMDGGQDNDRLEGHMGQDLLRGNDGDDLLRGGRDNDTVYGGRGNDELAGNQGDDLLEGRNGNDLLLGGSGDDTLLGGAGNDTLDGQWGSDTLNGGTGDDLITGGYAVDVFEFAAGDGADTITDFSASQDSLRFAAGTTITVSDDGTDTLVDYGTGTVLLEGQVLLQGDITLEFI